MAIKAFFGLLRYKFDTSIGDEDFPARLAAAGIDHVMGYGDKSLIDEGGIAVIGCSESYPYSMSMARYFTDRIAIEGIVPVLPAATGAASASITQVREANEDADMPACRAIVVMGGGADMPYPPTGDIEQTLRGIIESGGCVVSTADWGTLPDAANLEKRDKLMRAIARGMAVVGSDLPDWPYENALAMMREGKPVGAVPGKVGHPGSTGTNELLKRGVYPLVDAACIEFLVHATEPAVAWD